MGKAPKFSLMPLCATAGKRTIAVFGKGTVDTVIPAQAGIQEKHPSIGMDTLRHSRKTRIAITQLY
ncbi:MAG: hypothetical protein R3F53_18010 [Gammaproteobacteria bacterium]